MTAWRRPEAPDNPLTEDRKRLVRSYMDAVEEAARREAIEEGERQRRDREHAHHPTAAERPTHHVAEAQSPEPMRRRPALLVEATPNESAAAAAGRFAAAVEQARDEARQEAAEEWAGHVAAAVEEALAEARREAADETARRVAAAVEEARDEARREAAAETARRVAEAETLARREVAEAWTPVAEPVVEQETREPVEEVTPDEDLVEALMPEAVAEPRSDDAPESEAPDDSSDVLPLHKWVQSATPSEDGATEDWTRALLSNRRNAKPT